MSNAYKKNSMGTTHGHFVHMNDQGLDLAFIEAAHYDRDNSCSPLSPAQRPLDGTSNVEMYASKDVPVLAMPELYCMAHGTEHACKYVHVLQADMGICDLDFAGDPSKYIEAERITITASKTYTGRIER